MAKRKSPVHIVPRATATLHANERRGHQNPRRDRANAVGMDYHVVLSYANHRGITWEKAFEAMGGVELEKEKRLSPREAELARRRRAWKLDMGPQPREY